MDQDVCAESIIPLNSNEQQTQSHIPSESECLLCGKTFLEKEVFEKHMENEHKQNVINDLVFSMDNVLTTMENAAVDKVLEVNEKNVREFQCSLCQQTCSSKSILKRHKKRMHKVKQESSDTNVISHKSAENVSVNGAQHQQNHFDIKFECVMCRIDFQCIDEMDGHMDETHEGRRKLRDPDVIREGDEYEESSSDDSLSESGEHLTKTPRALKSFFK